MAASDLEVSRSDIALAVTNEANVSEIAFFFKGPSNERIVSNKIETSRSYASSVVKNKRRIDLFRHRKDSRSCNKSTLSSTWGVPNSEHLDFEALKQLWAQK